MVSNLSGKKIGQYELRERLGRGGMAEVYKAYQASMDRFIAIKVMLTHLADDEQFIERFRREARAVGKLRHPHILQVFDFGLEDDIYYMVMEYIKGGNLKAHISEQGKLDTAHALKITSQLADALSYAHNLGMIHRDMKPANVMFIDDAHQNSVLTDFGIARILTETGLTATGMSVGTPAYMSPEAGIGGDTDERSDLYALGVMLYEMLTGNAPYSADTPLAVIMKHINAPLPNIEDLTLPDVVERVVLKAMAKDPADRYQTAAEMRVAVDEALAAVESGAATKPVPTPAADSPAEKTTPALVQMPPAAPAPQPPTQQLPATEPVQRQTPPPPAPQNSFPLVGMSAVLVAAVFVIGLLAFLFTGRDDTAANTLPTLAATQVVAAENTDAPPPPPPQGAPPDSPGGERPSAPAEQPGQVGRPGDSSERPYPGILPPNDANLTLVSDLLPPFMQDMSVALIAGDGDFQRVETMIDNRLQRNPDDYEALLASALLNVNRGDGAAAQADAERMIELEPENPTGYILLSDAFWTDDHYDEDAAAAAIATAYELQPDRPAIMWRYAQRAADIGEDERIFFEAEQMGASGYGFIQYAGQLLYDMGLYERAAPYLEKLIRDVYNQHPNHPDAPATVRRLMVSIAWLEAWDNAHMIATRYTGLDINAQSYAEAAYVAVMADEFDDAEAWAQIALDEDPKNSTALWVMAHVAWWGNDELTAAMDWIGEAEREGYTAPFLTPEFGHYLYGDRAYILWEADEPGRALDWFTRGIEERVQGYEILYLDRADLHFELGNLEEARADYEAALRLLDDSSLEREINAQIRAIDAELAGES